MTTNRRHLPHTCPLCGRVVQRQGKGRPKERHNECRILESILVQLESRIQEVRFDAERGDALRRRLRGRVFTVLNQWTQASNAAVDVGPREHTPRPRAKAGISSTKRPKSSTSQQNSSSVHQNEEI